MKLFFCKTDHRKNTKKLIFMCVFDYKTDQQKRHKDSNCNKCLLLQDRPIEKTHRK